MLLKNKIDKKSKKKKKKDVGKKYKYFHLLNSGT